MGIMHEEAIKGLLENLQRQEQQPQQCHEQQPHPTMSSSRSPAVVCCITKVSPKAEKTL